jgi:hypothetical protein
VRSADPRWRAALLMPICALAVHQLRYYLAFGPHGASRLARDGHAYLSVAEPIVLFVGAVAAGAFVGRLARAWVTNGLEDGLDASVGSRRPGFVRIWAAAAVVLIAIYCGQELFEGAVFPAHPAGLAGVVGHGGWIALPLALAIAAALAALMRVSDAVVALVARLASARRRAPVLAPSRIGHFRAALDWRLDPAAGVSAGRAPPAGLVPA